MISKFFRSIAVIIVSVLFAGSANAQLPGGGLPSGASCGGKFINPISDVCWECLAPITLGAIPVFPSKKYDYNNPTLPICLCGIRPGLAIGFWEPRRLVDVTKKSWCFPNLGGLSIDPGIGFPDGSHDSPETNNRTPGWHSHYYIYPLLSWLELVTDAICAEVPSFDIGYVTELDPLWQDDGLSMIINPEVIAFANPIAALACTADCLSSTAGRSRHEMFWCMGCQGSTYPFNGNTTNERSLMDGAMLAAERMLFKLHRQGMAWSTAGKDKLCAKQIEPVMDKRQYRLQLTYPKSITSGPFTCPNIGAPTATYDINGTTYPIKGEDFGFLIWGKRNCCAL